MVYGSRKKVGYEKVRGDGWQRSEGEVEVAAAPLPWETHEKEREKRRVSLERENLLREEYIKKQDPTSAFDLYSQTQCQEY